MITLILLLGLAYIIAKIKDCGNNPEYEEWLIEDEAKYPELYKNH